MILQQDLAELAAALRSDTTTARALAEAAIANHDRGDYGAYKVWDPDWLLGQADAVDAMLAAGADLGPLMGLPVSIKDLYGLAGHRTHAGTVKPLPEAWEREGPVVDAVRGQGATVTGKTHTVEFAFAGIGYNPNWGTPRNPWDPERIPGGSSSGAGVSLAEGSAVLALGTDTSGSVRLPATMTGSVGVKTSHGRWSIDGIVPLATDLDTAGILTRSVRDARYAFDALEERLFGWSEEQHVPEAAQLRIGVTDAFFWDDCSPGVAEGVQAALAELEQHGAKLVEIDIPEAGEAYEIFRKGGLAAAALHEFVTSELPAWFDEIHEIVRWRMEEAGTLPAVELLARKRTLARLGASAEATLAEVDVLAGPTLALTPPPIADMEDMDTYRSANLLTLRNTQAANYLDLCAVTMPVALDAANMPVGLQLIAPKHDDARLLAVAQACENVLGDARQRIGTPPGLG